MKSHFLRDQTIEGKELAFGPGVRDVLGPDLVLRDCTLILRRKSQWSFQPAGVRMERCSIITKTPLKNNTFWTCAMVEDCKFEGTFFGNTFGLDPHSKHTYAGIVRPDFSRAKLQYCDVRGYEVSSFEIASWPQLAVVAPHEHRPELEALAARGLDLWVHTLLGNPRITLSLCWAEDVAELCEVSVGEVEELLERGRASGFIRFSKA